MRLYLSSYRFGAEPEAMLPLVRGSGRTAVVVNARDLSEPEGRAERVRSEIEALAGLGLRPRELDLREFFGRGQALAAELASLDHVWVAGGNTFVLRRAFRLSGFDRIITRLVRADRIAYGGYSAGACVLAPSLRGIHLADQVDDVPDGYSAEAIWEGLGLLGYAIAPHYRSDHPESQDIEHCVAYYIAHHMLFRALRDGEAIVVSESGERIVGGSAAPGADRDASASSGARLV